MNRVAVALCSLALLTLPTMPTAGAAAGPPVPAGPRAAPWRSTTSITWSGTKGVRLSSPTDLHLNYRRSGGRDVSPYQITLTRGTWAFARIVGPAGSPCTFAERPGPHCAMWMVSKAKELAHWPDGVVLWPAPNPLVAGTTEVYLFTDGAARLDLRPTGAPPGTARYEATGRVTGIVKKLPDQCVAACGTDDFGGEARTLASGSSDVLLVNSVGGEPLLPVCPQGDGCDAGVLVIGACASAAPQPRGCAHPGAVARWEDDSGFEVGVIDIRPECTQSCYLGWRKTGPGKPVAWGTWFEYGIR